MIGRKPAGFRWVPILLVLTAVLNGSPKPAAARTSGHSDPQRSPLRGEPAITQTEVELPSGTVWGIAEGAYGYLWFATDEGLTIDAGGSAPLDINTTGPHRDGLVHGATTSVIAADDEGVWFADGNLKRVSPWSNGVIDTGIPAGTVLDGPDHSLWTIDRRTALRIDANDPSTVLDEVQLDVWDTGFGPNPAASANDGSLYIVGGRGVTEVKPGGSTRLFVTSGRTFGVARRAEGGVWLSASSGLWRIDSDMVRPELLSGLPEERGLTLSRSVLELSDGRVVSAIERGGVALYDPTTGSWAEPDYGSLPDRPLVDVIYEDSQKRVWLATADGSVLRYRDQADFDSISYPDSNDGSHPRLEDLLAGDDALWAAMGSGGISRYDFEARSWSKPIRFERASRHDPAVHDARSIALFNDKLWVASSESGIFVAEPAGNVAKEWGWGMSGYAVSLLTTDTEMIFAAPWTDQAVLIDLAGRVVRRIKPGLDAAGADRAEIRPATTAMAVDDRYIYSMGEYGLMITEIRTGDSRFITRSDGNNWSSWASTIHVESEEVLWVGSDVGVERVDLNTGDVVLLSYEDGMTGGAVTNIVATADGHGLWVGSSNGLNLVDTASVTVEARFGMDDGLPSSSFRPGSAVGSDGRVYMATSSGIAILPDYRPNAGDTELDFDVRCESGCGADYKGGELRNPQRVTFQFITPPRDQSRRPPIEYRLSSDDPWVTLPVNTRTVSFGALRPGRYRLEARAVGNGTTVDADLDNETGVAGRPSHRTVTIIVDEEWWRRTTVQLEILAACALALAAALRIRDKRRKVHAARLERTIAERTEQLEQSRFDAEHANKAKDRFLMAVTHDLRSPLSGVVGYAELMGTTDLDPSQSHYLDGIQSSGRHLFDLVEDLLFQSSQLVGGGQANTGPTDLRAIVDDAVAFTRSDAIAQAFTISSRSVGCERLVQIDGRGLKYVLVNLLTNAIKYSNGQNVVVHVVRLTFDKHSARFRFSVTDDGGTVAAEDIPHLFEPGFRGSSVTGRGTGLGLSMSQDWVTARGGAIEATVSAGVYTEFSFELDVEMEPLVPGSDPLIDLTTTGPAACRRIMVVEDEPMVGDVLEAMLLSLGCETTLFPEAESALARMTSTQFDLVLTDVMMAPLSGIDLAALARAQHGSLLPPIVAVTGVPAEATASNLFDWVLSKPIGRRDLQQVVDHFLPRGVERPQFHAGELMT